MAARNPWDSCKNLPLCRNPDTFWDKTTADTYCSYAEVAIKWNFLWQRFWMVSLLELQYFSLKAVFGWSSPMHSTSEQQQVPTKCWPTKATLSCGWTWDQPVPRQYNPSPPSETYRPLGPQQRSLRNLFSRNSSFKDRCRASYFCEVQEVI